MKIKIVESYNIDTLRIAQETAKAYGYKVQLEIGKSFLVKEKDAQPLCDALFECGVKAIIENE